MSHPAERADTAEPIRARATLGEFELTVLSDGHYYLDGGAMFGVVPKPMWEKRAPADEQNRILLGTNTVVVRTGKHTVVIETGLGNKLGDKMRAIFGAKEQLPRAFAAAGINPEEVDIVINSHLHFDHCGWNTTLTSEGKVVPTFPNARYFAHRGEVDHGHLQLERDAVSYISANYDPLVESGQMELLEIRAGEVKQIVPGVSVEGYPGHTSQMMAINLDSGGQRACYISDLIPTSAHLDITWVMGYDLDPLRCIEERKRFYARAIPEKWLVLFTHDHHKPMGHVVIGEKGKPVLVQ
ncbi:MBL fold metallo-hydrolase [Acidipila rosea]|uniref:Glyoxylase-like metal-dependent hydrolase (Beta-lactamase superfamily II) n=1 Tax=Acidipila rosea TaxID=768535 RepID=A0A4V2PUV9_9BACT|nr:MBL fold metallo-hydrolase [Acidipila rosea]MBW4028132.1 MBL fold metallo-hydrolase [Acidobacteriota bacterium]MBW4046121.1 MBL fold metallo-hydrolase [Acidobacteriota bacterium]TCK71971.1 glyoxylase-like metal-dependent hydrolase (beta-lactamase superfamily II) [Acidipila rosea]